MSLTPREIEVLSLVAGGNTQSEIAAILDISYGTVNYHIDNVRLKTDASNTVHAVAICLREKIIL